MKVKITGYNDAIDGKPLVVKKTTRALAELQQQTGWDMSKLTQAELSVYGGLMAVFCALHNAGFNPSWDELLDRDTDDFELIEEPGDNRRQEVEEPDPQMSRADSDPGGDNRAADPAPEEQTA
ncbi:hypothetical protein [Microbacterium xylanilyticum]